MYFGIFIKTILCNYITQTHYKWLCISLKRCTPPTRPSISITVTPALRGVWGAGVHPSCCRVKVGLRLGLVVYCRAGKERSSRPHSQLQPIKSSEHVPGFRCERKIWQLRMNKRRCCRISFFFFNYPFKAGRFCWIEWLVQALISFLPWQPSWLWIVRLKEAAF